MSVETTAETMRSYLDALLARGEFADSFTDDITWTAVGTGQELQGRQPVRDFISWMHTQAFDAHPKVKTLVVGDGQATGKAVQVPYCVVYDLRDDKIAAVRSYMPMELLAQQLR
jgi:ketosteroid isomerase-like protein